MTEIRNLKKEDMDELFALLNDTFGHKYGRPMHFDLEQPKMWVRDDAHMERHIAVFEDGKMAAVVGIYPLPAVIGGEKFLFCTTGNVATLPQYEGKGYFSKLFPLAIEEAKRIGAFVCRLGGASPEGFVSATLKLDTLHFLDDLVGGGAFLALNRAENAIEKSLCHIVCVAVCRLYLAIGVGGVNAKCYV